MRSKKLLFTSPVVADQGEPVPTATKTIKIGVVNWPGWPVGLGFARGVELASDITNKKGGLDIGGDKYNIQLIVYDSKNSDETGRAAAERLVFEDKVKFIVGDSTADAWLPITEKNKVLVIACTLSASILNPNNKYAFQGMMSNLKGPALWGWFAKNHPNIKTIVCAIPDNPPGHIHGDVTKKCAEVFGLEMVELIAYPETTTDFSVVGTEVKSLNPDAFEAVGGGPIDDALVYKAAWEAGWRGQQFSCSTISAKVLKQVFLPEAMEGMILGAWAVEMDTPPPIAKEFKDAYIAKYGEWDGPELTQLNSWYPLTTALTEAKSLDVDKVAAVLANGIKYESPCSASATMISRPDLGNHRAVDTVGAVAAKKVVGGKVDIIASISLDEAIEYDKKFFGWK